MISKRKERKEQEHCKMIVSGVLQLSSNHFEMEKEENEETELK